MNYLGFFISILVVLDTALHGWLNNRRKMPRQLLYVWSYDSQAPGAVSKSLVPIQLFLPDVVENGPSDPYIASILTLTTAQGERVEDIKVHQLPRCSDTPTRDFLPDVEGDDFAADFVHVFTVARVALELVRNIVTSELGWKGKWRWAWQQRDGKWSTTNRSTMGDPPAVWSGDWEPSPLRIIPHAGEKFGASYFRSKRAILFYVSVVPELATKMYSCRPMSIVVHEAAHAILDAIDPSLYTNTGSMNRGGDDDAEDVRRTCDILHEAFADAMWVFTALAFPMWCDEALRESGGNLRRPCRANQMGAQCRSSCEAEEALEDARRSFLDVRTSWDCGRGVYSCSTVFVSFLWDIVVEVHAARLFSSSNEALNLHATAAALCHTFVRSVCRCVKSWERPSFPVLVEVLSSLDLGVSVLQSQEFQSSTQCDVLDAKVESQVKMVASKIAEITASCAATRQIGSLGIQRAKQRVKMLGDW